MSDDQAPPLVNWDDEIVAWISIPIDAVYQTQFGMLTNVPLEEHHAPAPVNPDGTITLAQVKPDCTIRDSEP